MRFAVDTWAPEYGSAMDPAALDPAASEPNLDVEVPVADWAPRRPPGAPLPRVLFVDGVRRVDARVWISGDDGRTRLGIAASYAAGVVGCDGEARLLAAHVRRGLFTPAPEAQAIVTRHGVYEPRMVDGDTAEQLASGLQQRMGELEARVADEVDEAPGGPGDRVLVVDGPLFGRQHVPGAIGYVKSHRVGYLPGPAQRVVAALAAGQRTPLFALTDRRWSRYSWYARLPGGEGHPWAGVVRCESSADLDPAAAARLADRVTATLPRFASAPHKDPRAPQNLYPIAGMEAELASRLGDGALLYRALRAAAT
ncbi:MAG: hypothetical protein M3N17_01000 [Actinomycetota bacterium]|nr:hypothetical protein [Actinomycetota bacterium]